jgi:hypothetical protein
VSYISDLHEIARILAPDTTRAAGRPVVSVSTPDADGGAYLAIQFGGEGTPTLYVDAPTLYVHEPEPTCPDCNTAQARGGDAA